MGNALLNLETYSHKNVKKWYNRFNLYPDHFNGGFEKVGFHSIYKLKTCTLAL